MKNYAAIRGAKGFTLVELMVALALGLFLTGVAVNVVVLNQQAFRTTENLSRMQENARSAFELMARDIRAAGGNPCGTSLVVNVLNTPANNWWANWGAGSVIGYENGVAPQGYGTPGQNAPAFTTIVPANNLTPNTDAILLLGGNAIEGLMITDHDPVSAQFKINMVNHGIQPNDIVMACDYQSAAIFQVSNSNQANATIVHNTGAGAPGNCTKGLGSPLLCTTNGTSKTFEDGGFLVRFSAIFWYVGNNNRGSNSLYRVSMNGTPTAIQTDEIIENVCVQGVTLQPENRACQGLQITYITRNTTTAVVAASAAAGIDWSVSSQSPKPLNANEVVAVRLSLDLQSRETSGVNNANAAQRLTTNMTETIFLRNRDASQ